MFACFLLITYLRCRLRACARKVSVKGRNLAWLVYASGAYDLCIELTSDMLAFNPSPSIKADVLYVRAHAQRENDATGIAANTFALLWDGAYLQDTETRWRPEGLYWWIEMIMELSKGPIYNLARYEQCIELLGEYELYLETNPWVPKYLQRDFVDIVDRVYTVMVQRHLEAADAYSRLGEDAAEKFHLDKAKEWNDAKFERIDALTEIMQ